ncbi:MAG TPA: helix-turn-helix transcriptional regulator [Mycobacteriales bacterium]|nr:helix-turn-helix transcriptional regulator [Mycobacteriales bacterium]
MGEVIDIRTGRRTKDEPEPLWREALGAQVRRLRKERGATLVQTAERAGISPQYLSELERGRKDPSSEMVAAVAGALDLSVLELTTHAVVVLRRSRLEATRATTRIHGPRAMLAA